MLQSDLPPSCRHLMHVLCIRIDAKASVILSRHQPSLTDLARDTGRNRRTIIRHLAVLDRRGWIIRARPKIADARTKHARTHYTLLIPARDTTSPRGLITASSELAAVGPLPGGSKPSGLVTQEPEARGTTPRRSSGSSQSSGPEIEAVIEAIREKAGITVSAEWAARVAEQVLGARDNIRDPARYARRVILAAPPSTYVPTPTPPKFSKEKGFE